MGFRQNIIVGHLFVNSGNNGWSEKYALKADDFTTAAADFGELCLARSYILGQGCEMVWAMIRRVMSPPPAQAILPAPLTSLLKPDTTPYWGKPHDNFSGPLLGIETAEGRWSQRLIRGVAGDEITGNEWLRVDSVWPLGPTVAPAVPNLATKDELFRYYLCLLRDKTYFAHRLPDSTTGSTDWDVFAIDSILYKTVSGIKGGRPWKYVSWEPADYVFAPAFSPCGMRVGVVRSAYEAPCLFYHDGLPRRIRWYDAPAGADMFPLPTIFWPYSQDMDYENLDGVGERTNRLKSDWRPGLAAGVQPGDHYCGVPDDFLGVTDVPFDPSLPTPSPLLCECDLPMPLIVQELDGTPSVPDVWIINFDQGDGFSVVSLGGNAVRIKMTHPPSPPPPPPLQVTDDPLTVAVVPTTLINILGDERLLLDNPLPGMARLKLPPLHITKSLTNPDHISLDSENAEAVWIQSVGVTNLHGIKARPAGTKLVLVNAAVDGIWIQSVSMSALSGEYIQFEPNQSELCLGFNQAMMLEYGGATGCWTVVGYPTMPGIGSGLSMASVETPLLRQVSRTGSQASPQFVTSSIHATNNLVRIDAGVIFKWASNQTLVASTLLDPGFGTLTIPGANDVEYYGATPQQTGQILFFYNLFSNDIVFRDENGGAPATSRFHLPDGKDITVPPGRSLILMYGFNRWYPCLSPIEPLIVWGEVPAGTIDGVNGTFTLANNAAPGKALLYVNGVLQVEGINYTLGGNTINFLAGNEPAVGDTLNVSYEAE